FTLKRGGQTRVTARVRRGPSPAEERTELAKLAGHWKPVRGEFNGQPLPAQMFELVRSIVAEGNTIRIERTDGLRGALTVRLDPTATPKRIDATVTASPESTPVADITGIYKLEKDTLTICVSERRDERPTEFVTRPRSGHRLVVFRRLQSDEGKGKRKP
ncbi:MAG TPA: TIGR03067 domain-containing protein, partial [Gemmataceae bacterium]|nr:TIGR03067 domain-containing protein [Gemmataceae bacterium]